MSFFCGRKCYPDTFPVIFFGKLKTILFYIAGCFPFLITEPVVEEFFNFTPTGFFKMEGDREKISFIIFPGDKAEYCKRGKMRAAILITGSPWPAIFTGMLL